MYKHYIKRLLDFIIVFMILLIIWPIILIIAISLYFVNSGAGVFFTQKRPGKDGRIFKVLKFKTMNDNKDSDGNLLSDEERLTKVGRFVRTTSLDELPQLYNVLKGDMSLIGPRPLLVDYLPFYTKEEMHRHDVRPGITGLAQVNGRNFISWEEIFNYDLEYVNNVTFMNDIKIIIRTITKVIKRKEVADLSKSYIGQDGRKHFIIDGVDYSIHKPLNEERNNL